MDTPDFFVGARLGGARVKAGISLEKAAKDTRIRVQRLREIEADDFSGFTHPTYSRLFLLDYAEYLGVPADEIRPMLPDRAGSAGGGFQYINELSRNPSSPVVPKPVKRPNIFRVFAALGIALVLVAAGLFVYSTVKKIGRVTGSAPLSEKATGETAAAIPQPERAAETPDAAAMPAAAGPAEQEPAGPADPSTTQRH